MVLVLKSGMSFADMESAPSIRVGCPAYSTASSAALAFNQQPYVHCVLHDRPLISIHGRSCQSDMWLQHTLYAARSQPDNSALPVTDGVIVDDTLLQSIAGLFIVAQAW